MLVLLHKQPVTKSSGLNATLSCGTSAIEVEVRMVRRWSHGFASFVAIYIATGRGVLSHVAKS